MKRVFKIIISITTILTMCCSCSKSTESELIGYWMDRGGNTISFTDESSSSVNGNTPQNYKVYDGNHLQIVGFNGIGVSEYVFEVEGDILKLRLTTDSEYTEYTKDEEKQAEIIKDIEKQIEIIKNDIISKKD